MGIPKFYRWISERYPCLSEVVKEYQIPEFDNLYLDMNGIIHACSHPNDDDPKFRITEEKIMRDISHYIEVLFRLVKPKKVFFLAVDGVAPRAKMNQQRGRRFRSAKEATDNEQKAIQRGEILPKEERFDSNCITPGTHFMARLNEHLKYFITKNISTDRTWQGIRIYLSGHNTPGEGEHKIMDFIRSEKTRPDYDPNTRHCLYGLDADLIMLGMCTHDPHFSLLREEVRFTGRRNQKKTPTVEDTTFHLLHLSLLRDYLDHEFSPLKTNLKFRYDLEKIVDDWVMMGFLVGNDFIPNLPHLHIVQGALSKLYETYMEVLPSLDGYINEDGYLNLKRFEKYMERLSQVDQDHFEEFFTDFKYLESKKPSNEEAWTSKRVSDRKQLEALKRATDELLLDFVDDVDDECYEEDESLIETDEENLAKTLAEMEYYQNKRDYYTNKLNYPQLTEAVLREQAEGYVRAIQWTLHYYYNGVCSWSWYYPHHYAPFISDIKNISHLTLDFELGEPFLPFEQLLSVLPAASKQFLPKHYQYLMCDKNSALIDYYPVNFETDLNGKQHDWEAVVLLPFIDEKRLIEAMKPLSDFLTDDERARNTHGPCLLFTKSDQSLGTYHSYWSTAFPDIDFNYAKCEELPRDVFRVAPDKLVKGLWKKIDLDICFLGFPTLRHIPHKATLKKAEVRVFQQNSRGENMILQIERRIESGARQILEELMGDSVFVGWPHLIEAKVVSVANVQCRFVIGQNNQIHAVELNKNEVNAWHLEAASVKETYMKRWGIDVGEIIVLVYATQLVGAKKLLSKNGKVFEEKQYSKRPSPYASQMVIKDLKVISSFKINDTLTAQELFPMRAPCFLLTVGEHYGRMAEINKVTDNAKKGTLIEVNMLEHFPEPELQTILNEYQNYLEEYCTARVACHRLGISCHMLSRITSMLHISSSEQKINLGLNMKSAKRNEEMPGYTRKTSDGWGYSNSAIETVEEYLKKFPQLFEFLAGHPSTNEMLQEEDLIINCPEVNLSEVQTFLKSLPSYSINCCPCGSEFLPEALSKPLEEVINQMSEKAKLPSKVLTVRPQFLHVPSNVVTLSSDLPPDLTSHVSLLDRIIYVKEGGTVPLGLTGTVIGIVSGENETYEILFDSTFEGAYSTRGFSNRIYRLQKVHIMNISHGLRNARQDGDLTNNLKPTAVVHPQSASNKNQSKNTVVTRVIRRDRGQSVKQTTTMGGQAPARSTGINHSPNSPFVPSKPYFCTPTMSTEPKMGPATAGPTSLTGQRDGEFQEMWKQLQNKKKQNRKTPAGGGGSPALIQAAKSLPKARVGGPPLPAFGGQQTADQQQALTMKPSQEFANILQALEHQTNVAKARKTKNQPLDDLFQQLKMNDVEPKEAVTQIQVGQSIPLEELFKTPTNESTRQPIRKPELSQLTVAPSHVMTLMNMSQQLMRGIPMYSYHHTPEKLIVAQVTLPNGITAHSHPCSTQQEAAEIAAQLAKLEFTTLNQFDGQQKKQVRAPVLLAPAYIQPYLARPPILRAPVLFSPQNLRQQTQPVFHQPPTAVRPQWANFNYAQTSPHIRAQSQTPAKNPFVPLQVTKHSKSGKGVTPVTTTGSGRDRTKADSAESEENMKKASATGNQRVASSSTGEDNSTTKKKPAKKRKSKLAINFNANSN